jgi:predicted nucleotidyltransferase
MVASHLAASVSSLEGICLFGSVARGDETEWSDIDLLAIGSDRNMMPTDLLNRLPGELQQERISLIYYPTEEFKEMFEEGALFVEHLRREGKVLYDKHGLLERVVNGPFSPNVDVEEQLDAELDRLAPYDDLRRFNDNFLFCLSHLYTIGKGVVMLGLARRGLFEFNRERAFDEFAKVHPELTREIHEVTQLRPFYQLATRRKPDVLPFPYVGSGTQVAKAVDAIRRLGETVRRDGTPAGKPSVV